MLNLMVRFALPSDIKPEELGECENCKRATSMEDTLEIDLSVQQLCVGDEIPAGVCPHCQQGYVYVYDTETE